MEKKKLVLLYGFASSGKTTLAKMYIDEHLLAIAVEGDQIIGMMGQWRKNEDEARSIVFEHTKSIARNQLKSGHSVLLPYLLTDATQAEVLEEIARNCGASFYEIYINIEKDEAIQRLFERGVWGEEGSPRLSSKDLPEIHTLYDSMETAMSKRSSVQTITSVSGDIEGTYSKFVNAIAT